MKIRLRLFHLPTMGDHLYHTVRMGSASDKNCHGREEHRGARQMKIVATFAVSIAIWSLVVSLVMARPDGHSAKQPSKPVKATSSQKAPAPPSGPVPIPYPNAAARTNAQH